MRKTSSWRMGKERSRCELGSGRPREAANDVQDRRQRAMLTERSLV